MGQSSGLSVRLTRMWCLTAEEAKAWCPAGKLGVALEAAGPIHGDFGQSITVPLSPLNWSRLAWFANFTRSFLEPYDECLLWVTLHGVWSSSENWHLFYRLRETYGERRPLHQAPGHLFLDHESADLATFIGLALQFGWDFHLLPAPAYATAFISHDEFMHLYPRHQQAFDSAKQSLDAAQLSYEVVAGHRPRAG